MKKVRIRTQQVGIVYNNGDYKRTLPNGINWLWWNEQVVLYKRNTIYGILDDIEIAMENGSLNSQVELITINSNEIGIVYMREQLSQVIQTGQYFYFKGAVDMRVQIIDLNSNESIKDFDGSVLTKTTLSTYVRSYTIESYEKGLLFEDGKFVKELDNGTFHFWIGSKKLELKKVDTRVCLMEISGQELLSKDKAAIRVNFQLEYQVIDTVKALLNNQNFQKQLYNGGQLALREITSSMNLDELLNSKEIVSEYVLKSIRLKSESLGIRVASAGIRDIILPGEVKEIMNRVLIAEKQAQANTIARREETASTRTMLNTAKLMSENEMLFKLKEMEYLERIVTKVGEVNISSEGAVLNQLSHIFTK